ncbi:hypothetical protein BDQ12DRAFT_679287 [Crucibulum laeve]|uniref:Uncharacterized protein n=1 Tax=Crucibulum laeve TaxID=68775 RepID=A0A5C3MA44_9AGAR|nr:hypothetical protein BDQ12DRAFT_679287 [Crucibulum laeve]
MSISFTPALEETLRLPVPSAAFTDALQLEFSALLNLCDYDQLKKDGAKVQIWTNTPLAGHAAGEWRELDFVEAKESSTSAHPSTLVSLLPNGTLPPGKAENSNEVALTLRFYVPLSKYSTGQSQLQYAFTYRIVYASGEIKWLGQFGRNGSIILDYSSTSDSVSPLRDGWTAGEYPGSYVYQLDDVNSNDEDLLEIGSSTDYHVWAFEKGSLLSNPRNASILFLIPRSRIHPLIVPQIYALGASSGITISQRTFIVTAAGTGTILLQTYDSRKDTNVFARSLLSHSTSALHLLSCGQTGIVLASPSTKNIVKAVAIPFLDNRQNIHIALEPLSAMLFNGITLFSVFCPANHNTCFLDTSPDDQSDKTLSLISERSGSRFILSPVYDIGDQNSGSSPGIQWKVSILTSHEPGLAPLALDDADILPTPPPSPRLKPIARISSHSSNEGGISSVPSLTDVGIAFRSRDVPVTTTESSAALIIRSGRPQSSMSVLVFLKHIFATISVFLEMVYRLFFGRIREVEDSDNEEDDDDKHDATESISPDTDLLGGVKPIISSSENPVGELKPITEDCIPSISVQVPPKPEEDPQEDESSILKKIIEHEPIYPLTSKTAFHAELTEGGPVTIALAFHHVSSGEHATGLLPTLNEITNSVQLNGHIPESAVRKHKFDFGGGTGQVYLLEFDSGKGGWVKISPVGLDNQMK